MRNRNEKEFKFEKDGYVIYTYPDQKKLSDFLSNNPYLSGKDMIWIYELFETKRIIREKKRIITSMQKVGWVLIYIVLFIVILIYFIDIPYSSLFISNMLFGISIFFSIYIFSKKINIYDKQRELDKYKIILEMNKNIKNISKSLGDFIKEKTK